MAAFHDPCAPRVQQPHREPLPEIIIGMADRRPPRRFAAPQPLLVSSSALSPSSSRPFTTCYTSYRSLSATAHRNCRGMDGQRSSSARPHSSSGAHHSTAGGPSLRSPVDASANMLSPRRSPGRRRSSHLHPRGIVDDHNVASELLAVTKRFREVFLLSTGKRATSALKRFEQSLHFSDEDREVVLSCLHRCHQFMAEVESLLRCAVDGAVALDRSVVRFAFLRWGEAHTLSRDVKRVLQHKHSGVNLYCPDASVDDGVMPSVVQRVGGGGTPARAVLRGCGGSAIGPHRSRPSTPVSFRRLCAHALPTYESIASRWSPRRQRTVGGHRSAIDVDDGGAWRSAVDELRERELHSVEEELLKRLETLMPVKHAPRAAVGDDSSDASMFPAADVTACTELLHRVQTLLTDLQNGTTGGPLQSSSGVTDGPSSSKHQKSEEEVEAAFLMWLSTVPPKLLSKIETLLLQQEVCRSL